MTQLHRLTREGISRYQEFLDSQSSDQPQPFDRTTLVDKRYAESVGASQSIREDCNFENRFEAAVEISEILKTANLSDATYDRGLWSWLSWYWFESLCSAGRDGRRKPGDASRWILDLEWNRYYRHLLAGPWWIYRQHADDPQRALGILCTPVSSPGEVVEQMASRQEFVTNPGLIEMVTLVAYDTRDKKHKRGIAGKGPGSARRLADVLNQLDLVWDLYSMSATELLELLPKEFSRYLPERAAT